MSDLIRSDSVAEVLREIQKLHRGESDIDFGAHAACEDALSAIAALPAASPEPALVNEEAVAEAMEGGGFWKACSGCHESNEGVPTGTYSKELKCFLGGGCYECGGIGAIWDNTDYSAFGEHSDTPPEPVAVRVKELVWADFEGKGAKAQAWNNASYMIQKWSDGRFEISASYPGYSTFVDGADRFYPTIDAAKSAAQADYEARILSSTTSRPEAEVRAEAWAAAVEAAWQECDDWYYDLQDDRCPADAIRSLNPPADIANLLAARDALVRERALLEAAQTVVDDAGEFDHPSTHYMFGRLADKILALIGGE